MSINSTVNRKFNCQVHHSQNIIMAMKYNRPKDHSSIQSNEEEKKGTSVFIPELWNGHGSLKF